MDSAPKPLPVRGNKLILRIADHFQLLWRLMKDARVHPLYKAIPVIGAAYLLFPYDIPLPLDDLVVLWLTLSVFLEACPPEIVEEHRQAIASVIPAEWKDEANPDG
jgi:uncharacterized membrane protein YkvA (DUF1232 family)